MACLLYLINPEMHNLQRKGVVIMKKRNTTKKLVIAAVVVLVAMSISMPAMAEGGKNQGTVGTGTTTTIQDPEPFDWPGIDWN